MKERLKTEETAADPAAGGRGPVRAAIAVFLLNGLTLSTYIVRLPALKQEIGLSDAGVGAIGVAFAVSALTSMQIVGALVRRFGSAPVLRTSLVGMPILLAAVGTSGNFVELCLAGAALGAAHGTTDAAMNAHGVAVERSHGRPILNRCHAAWSVSAVVASLTSAAVARLGVSTAIFVGVTALLLLTGGLLLSPALQAPSFAASTAASGEALSPAAGTTDPDGSPTVDLRGFGVRGRSRRLAILGLSGTLLMMCEGAALGWGVLLLQDVHGATLGVATLAVTAYTGAQTTSRLFGDRLTARYRAPLVFRASVILAAAGLAATVIAPTPWLAIAGFVVMGLGMATPLPLAFSAIGAISPSGGVAAAVARFTTFTYGGILLGPVLVGSTAAVLGLALVMGTLAGALLIVGLAYRLPNH